MYGGHRDILVRKEAGRSPGKQCGKHHACRARGLKIAWILPDGVDGVGFPLRPFGKQRRRQLGQDAPSRACGTRPAARPRSGSPGGWLRWNCNGLTNDAVPPEAVVEVRACRGAGRADEPDDLPLRHVRAGADALGEPGEVQVVGLDARPRGAAAPGCRRRRPIPPTRRRHWRPRRPANPWARRSRRRDARGRCGGPGAGGCVEKPDVTRGWNRSGVRSMNRFSDRPFSS